MLFPALAAFFAAWTPLLLVCAISFAAGVLMLVVFRYTSDQKKIRRAKDQVQAQLLAVRLFQDQLPAVLRAYGRLLRGSGRYIGLMLKPTVVLVFVFAPMIFLLDPYFGWQPLQPKQNFLMQVRVADANAVDGVALQLPDGIQSTAPPVHIPAEHEIVWRLSAEKPGTFPVTITADGKTISKTILVSGGLARISASSLSGGVWQRLLEPGAEAIPDNSSVRSLAVGYPARELNVWFFGANWIIVFFAVSIVAALLFKKALHVEI